MRLLLTSFCFLLVFALSAQNQVGINQSNVDRSAVLEMNSTTKGFLLPRMNTGNRNSISSPAQGLFIYETTSNALWYFNGAGWIKVISDGDTGDGIGDVDSDTRVFLDFTNDNDQVRFFSAGTFHFRMNRQRFDVLGTGSTVKLGDSTAINDDMVSNLSTYVGKSAGRDVVSGRSNVAIGYQAMRNNIEASDNVAIGNFSALRGAGTTTRRYIAIGVSALVRNASSGQHSVIGHFAATNHISQNNVHAIGIGALQSDVSGVGNIAIGTRSLSSLTTQSNSTAIGYETGTSSTVSSTSIYLGYRAGASNSMSNQLFIGNSATPLLQGSFSNDQITISDNLHVTNNIVYTGNLTDVSDRRLKSNIKAIDNVLPKLTQLNTYRYHLKSSPEGELEYGLIAQEVKLVFPSLVRKIEPATDKIGVSYVQFIPLLLQAEKEQFSQLEQMIDRNRTFVTELDDLSTRLKHLRKAAENKKSSLSDLN